MGRRKYEGIAQKPEDYLKRWNEALSVAQISERYGVCGDKVRTALKDQGVDLAGACRQTYAGHGNGGFDHQGYGGLHKTVHLDEAPSAYR